MCDLCKEQAHIASREGGALLLIPHARGGSAPPQRLHHMLGGGSWPRTPPETRGQTLRALDFTPHFEHFRGGNHPLELYEP